MEESRFECSISKGVNYKSQKVIAEDKAMVGFLLLARSVRVCGRVSCGAHG